MSASEALGRAVAEALAALPELNGCYEGPPLQAAFPYATAEVPVETDWGHKSGAGRELRLIVTLRDEGERPTRLRRITAEAEAAVAGAGAGLEGAAGAGWRLVSLVLLRSRLAAAAGRQWTSLLDYRARLLAE